MLYQQLLVQAKHLAGRDPRRPQQANLRRAVSAAYYALFHFFLQETATFLLGRSEPFLPLRHLLIRAFQHSEMAGACKAFQSGTLPRSVAQVFDGQVKIPEGLKSLAEIFVELQEERYKADYDLTETFNRTDVMNFIQEVEQAIHLWPRVSQRPEAALFLLSLLFWEKIRKR